MRGADASELEAINKSVTENKAALRDAQTKIRVLAPRKTLDAAQALRESMDRLDGSLRPDLSDAGFSELRETYAGLREEFITRAKKSMELPS